MLERQFQLQAPQVPATAGLVSETVSSQFRKQSFLLQCPVQVTAFTMRLLLGHTERRSCTSVLAIDGTKSRLGRTSIGRNTCSHGSAVTLLKVFRLALWVFCLSLMLACFPGVRSLAGPPRTSARGRCACASLSPPLSVVPWKQPLNTPYRRLPSRGWDGSTGYEQERLGRCWGSPSGCN